MKIRWVVTVGVVIGSLWIAFPGEGAIPNFQQVEEGFFRGGQPGDQEIEALHQLGFQTVVSFRNEKDVIQWERGLVEKRGMTFISIPLSWKRLPTNEEAIYFLEIAKDESRRPLFIHCREGRDRAGAMTALYRIARQGWPVEKAYAEAKRLGFREAAFPLRDFILGKAEIFREISIEIPSDSPQPWEHVLFYTFEALSALLGLGCGVVCFRYPELAIHFQTRLYAFVNWRMEPISMKKEIRNTRIMGAILLLISFAVVISVFLFAI